MLLWQHALDAKSDFKPCKDLTSIDRTWCILYASRIVLTRVRLPAFSPRGNLV